MTIVLPTKRKDDCFTYAASHCTAFAAAGAGVGFFKAHFGFRELPLKEKMEKWGAFTRTAKIAAGPVAYFASIGFLFAATECAASKIREKDDVYNSILAGLAAGTMVGARRGTAPAAVGFGLLFAGGAVASEFFGKTTHEAFDGLKSYGPVEKGNPKAVAE